MPDVWVIVVAAGAGSRFGAPKQFLDVAGERVIDRSVATAARHAAGVVVVVPAAPLPGIDRDVRFAPESRVVVRTVPGGPSRAESVRRGLAAVPESAEVVLVHDGARPLASDEVYRRVIEAVEAGADAVVPAVPVTDTIRHRQGGIVERSELLAVQTPQGFRASVLRSAHESGAEATDDASLAEANGSTVTVVDGDRRNLKITTPLDLELASALVGHEEARP